MLDPRLKIMFDEAIDARRDLAAKQLALPWDEPAPGMPTDIARSAIFTARQDRDIAAEEPVLRRQMLTKQIVPCDHAVIEYTGPVLNQNDADVWLSVVFLCRLSGRTSVETRGATLINMIREGTPSGAKRVQTGDRENLLKRVKALAAGSLSVKYNNGGSAGSHLLSYHRDDADNYRFQIPAETLKLFYDDHVLIDYAVRILVSGQLAKWLHTYFAKNLTPVLIETIRELSACQTKNDRKFRQLVGDALEEIVRASAAAAAAERRKQGPPLLPGSLITNAGLRGKYAFATNDPKGELPKLPSPKRGQP